MHNCETIKEYDMIVDVRSWREYQFGHISGCRCIPPDELAERMHELNPDDKIGIYCRSGARSKMVVEYLKTHGYDVTDLGGINQFVGCISY